MVIIEDDARRDKTGVLGEGCRTDASAADELSCSPSAASGSAFALGVTGDSGSAANLLAASPPLDDLALVGVFGDGRTVFLVWTVMNE